MGRRSIAVAAAALICTLATVGTAPVDACTAFCAAAADGRVLVGNNEDFDNPRTRVWFVPAETGSFGRMFVGFDDLWPQGGMNDRGLWFDGFAAPAIGPDDSPARPRFDGNIVDAAMARCATVDEVVRLFSAYDRSFLSEGILMFADASGDAVSIERTAIVRKTRQHFVQTNFHQSRRQRTPDTRFSIASQMLDDAGGNISVDLFRRVLAATHQNGAYPTLYSNIYDLRAKTMQLFFFHDFARSVTIDLEQELKKGRHEIAIPSLFPPNREADAFARGADAARIRAGGNRFVLAGVGIIFVLVAAAGVYALVRGARGVRIAIVGTAGALILAVALVAFTLAGSRTPSVPWLQFSIGPPAGQSVSIGPNAMHANGITLKGAIATAYEFPPVRVVGPPWLADTRYSITAVASVDAADSFRSMLRRELDQRLRLATHIEVRPFDVFVLTASDARRVPSARFDGPSTWFRQRAVKMRGTAMTDLALALQSITGRPVIDETGLPGAFDLDLEWGDDAVATVTTALRERYGLRLAPASRNLEALIIDNIQPEAALMLFAGVGRATRSAPASLREHIAHAFSIR